MLAIAASKEWLGALRDRLVARSTAEAMGRARRLLKKSCSRGGRQAAPLVVPALGGLGDSAESRQVAFRAWAMGLRLTSAAAQAAWSRALARPM